MLSAKGSVLRPVEEAPSSSVKLKHGFWEESGYRAQASRRSRRKPGEAGVLKYVSKRVRLPSHFADGEINSQ